MRKKGKARGCARGTASGSVVLQPRVGPTYVVSDLCPSVGETERPHANEAGPSHHVPTLSESESKT